ncbi:MAG TPA: DedA family protein [Candidatus Saccharimonadales bacterium]|nr:DedA family protein [Candidatus Saccharimonadales bacterium]
MLHDLDIEEILRTIGVLGIAAIIFAESGLLIGFFLPGDTLLFTVGFLASQGVVQINLVGLISILFFAAVIGDSVGYSIGYRFGRRLFKKPDSLFFSHKNLERAEKFYEKYGPITIILARFTPLVRTFAPTVAGIAQMKYSTFLTYNVIGGALWTTSLTLFGFYGGAFLDSKGINVDALVLPIIALAVLVTVASPIYHILKDKDSREILLKKLKIKSSKTDN